MVIDRSWPTSRLKRTPCAGSDASRVKPASRESVIIANRNARDGRPEWQACHARDLEDEVERQWDAVPQRPSSSEHGERVRRVYTM